MGFISLLILAGVHYFANQSKVLGWLWHGRFLSFAAGLSFAYVFVDLLPSLEKGQPVLKQTFNSVIPYLDKHTYVIALLGVLFYYGIDKQRESGKKWSFWMPLAGYILFNFFVGASLSDSKNPETQPLILFTVAMGMHYFVKDHNAMKKDTNLFDHWARQCLVGALFLGYIVESVVHIPNTFVALAVSFLAGGILLNVFRYELPKREAVGYLFFVIGSLFYTVLLLSLGK